MFELIGDGIHAIYNTKDEAIAAAREICCESFEIYNEDNVQVWAERPEPTWV